ncbi:MAG: NYN domain-containing protein [Alphaproteobacteria bacterium]|jgi:uncharacterized LabA/DUF88 family protein|nr:NYN domain-containing protein [Alphaproteobacteria bacterium]
MLNIKDNERFAVFIDGSNFHSTFKSLGFDVDFARMLEELKKTGRLVRAYYYTALPHDGDFAPIRRLADWLDYNGYTVISKQTRDFYDTATGSKRTKGNMDMELALDMLKLAPHIDHAVLFSGDGDFVRLIEEMQNRGLRMTVVSSTKTKPPIMADVLRRQTDDFVELDDFRELIGRPHRDDDGNDDYGDDDYDDDDDDGAVILDDRRRS